MTSKKSAMDNNDNLNMDKLYDRLLFDEEFQKLRTEALAELPKNRQEMLGQADGLYLSGQKPPKWIAKKISKDYSNRLREINQSNGNFLRKVKNILAGYSFNHPFFSSGAFITAGLLAGLLLPSLFNSYQPQFRGAEFPSLEGEHYHTNELIFKLGISRKEKEFGHIFYQAALDGDAEAQNKIGNMLKYGEVFDKDLDKAFYWYKKSAEKGYVMAQYNLGFMYLNGLGVPQNTHEAEKWFEVAGSEGDNANKTK